MTTLKKTLRQGGAVAALLCLGACAPAGGPATKAAPSGQDATFDGAVAKVNAMTPEKLINSGGYGEFKFSHVVSDEYVATDADTQTVAVGGSDYDASCEIINDGKASTFSISMAFGKTEKKSSRITVVSRTSELVQAMRTLEEPNLAALTEIKAAQFAAEARITEYEKQETTGDCFVTVDNAQTVATTGAPKNIYLFNVKCPETRTKPVGSSEKKSFSRGELSSKFACPLRVLTRQR